MRVQPVNQKRLVLTRHPRTALPLAISLVIKDFSIILDVNGATTPATAGALRGAAEVHFTLYNVDISFVARTAEGVVIIVAVVVLWADFAAKVFREVELEAIVRALAGLGEAVRRAA